MSDNSKYANILTTEIGRIEAAVSGILNPFDRDRARERLLEPTNMRNPPHVIAEITRHYENLTERFEIERHVCLTAQLGIPMTNPLKNMKRINLLQLTKDNYLSRQP